MGILDRQGIKHEFSGVFHGELFGDEGAIDDAKREGKLVICDDSDLVLYLCPQCNKPVAIELGNSQGPSWKMDDHGNGTVSFSPSVIHTKSRGGCGAHYFIKKNKIEWCGS